LAADFQVPLVEDRYPKQLTLEKTQDLLSYMQKHYGLDFQRKMPKTPQDCARLVNEVLLELDKRAA